MKVLQLNCLNSEDQDTRLPQIVETIAFYSPDIIALQEVVYPELFVEALLEVGFSSVWKKYGAGNLLIATNSEEELEEVSSEAGNALHAKTVIDGVSVFATSTHLAWGETSEGERLRVASLIDQACENVPSSLSILCGDFNAEPDSRIVRFLKGKDLDTNGRSTLWMDAWEESRNGGSGATTLYRGMLGARAAKRKGIKRIQQLPDRRIDFIMTKGWLYGKTGYPTSCYTFGDGYLSDHKGLIAELQKVKQKND